MQNELCKRQQHGLLAAAMHEVTCSMAVGSAPEVRMKTIGVRAVVSGRTPSRLQGCPWTKAGPRVSPMYLWHPSSSLSSLITCIAMYPQRAWLTLCLAQHGGCLAWREASRPDMAQIIAGQCSIIIQQQMSQCCRVAASLQCNTQPVDHTTGAAVRA